LASIAVSQIESCIGSAATERLVRLDMKESAAQHLMHKSRSAFTFSIAEEDLAGSVANSYYCRMSAIK
jgi:hypothetical protein